MKIKTLLLGIAVLSVAVSVSAQTIVSVAPGIGTLESTINADTTATGERNDPNTIYELEPGGVYLSNSGVKFVGSTGTLTVRMQADAPEGSRKPILGRIQENGVFVAAWVVEGNLTMENIYYDGLEMTEGAMASWLFNVSGEDHSLLLDGCVFEFTANLGIFNMNVTSGAKIDIRNSYFRDMNNFKQWWQGRVVECQYPVDELLFENNTVCGGGLTILSQQDLYEYAVINHNTFINNHKYPFLNLYYKEMYFTNNLFVNTNMVGEDAVNIATGGQDPDGRLAVMNDDGTITTDEMWFGITGLDTITLEDVDVQDKYITADSTLSDEIDEISDYIYYCADNVVVSSAILDSYYAGETGSWTGVLSSYITWGGIGTAPFEVGNVPGIWRNSRAEALDADHDNIVWENNSVYEMRAADLGLGTEVLTEAAAEVFIQWNQNAWGVPDASKPTDFTAYQFGDYDATTIPGIEVESAGAGEGGITKISDLLEDFSYTADLKSKSDGLQIGSLIWDDLYYDSDASVAAVKAAYNNEDITGIEETIVGTSSALGLKNYPNPFANSTTISFNISAKSYVSLQVYDISGSLVSQLINEVRASGINTVEFTPDYSANKVYFYKLSTDFGTEIKKMMLVK